MHRLYIYWSALFADRYGYIYILPVTPIYATTAVVVVKQRPLCSITPCWMYYCVSDSTRYNSRTTSSNTTANSDGLLFLEGE